MNQIVTQKTPLKFRDAHFPLFAHCSPSPPLMVMTWTKHLGLPLPHKNPTPNNNPYIGTYH